MKGVILAGGLGKRLEPLTRITNKHLLAVYNKPMIYYPIQTLVEAGIKDILIVTGGNHAGDFLRLLGNGKEFGLKYINLDKATIPSDAIKLIPEDLIKRHNIIPLSMNNGKLRVDHYERRESEGRPC